MPYGSPRRGGRLGICCTKEPGKERGKPRRKKLCLTFDYKYTRSGSLVEWCVTKPALMQLLAKKKRYSWDS